MVTEGREPTLVNLGRIDERIVVQAFEAGAGGQHTERLRNALDAAVEIAETDLEGTRAALWRLRSDPNALERLERGLDCRPEQATFAIGAVIQIAHKELSSPKPDLRARVPELLRWLEARW